MRAYPPPELAAGITDRLTAIPGVRHLVVGATTADGLVELTAEIDADATDSVLDILRASDLAAEDFTLARMVSVRPLGWRHLTSRAGRDATVWAEVNGGAHLRCWRPTSSASSRRPR